MSVLASITQSVFKKMQDNTAGSRKKLLKYCHAPQPVLPIHSILKKIDVTSERINGIEYFVATGKGKKPGNKAVILIHGGGFVFQISPQHWKYTIEIIKHTNATVYIPIYPLSNEKYSSQMDTNKFLLDVYKVVLENKKLKSITIFGDSAGGNFALILAQQIKVHKLRRPDNVILVSPALSFVKTKEAIQHFSSEVIFTEAFFFTLREWQLRDAHEEDPLYSPYFGDCKNIGKIYIFCANNEFFAYQAKQFCNKLLKDKIRYNLTIKKNMFHDFPLAIIPKEAVEINNKIFKIIKG